MVLKFGFGKILAGALDLTSAILLEPTTLIRDPTLAAQKVAQRRRDVRAGKKGAISSIIGETLTATALVGGLVLGGGTVIGRSIVAKTIPRLLPTTVPKALGTATIGGILITSPTARDIVAKTLDDPTKIGREAGKIIEKVKAGEDTGKLGEVLKTAGLVGAGVVGGAALVAGSRKIKEVLGKEKPPIAGSPTSTPPSVALPPSPIPIQQTVSSESVPVVSQPPKEPPSSLPKVVVKTNIKINNRSSVSRRFINNVNV